MARISATSNLVNPSMAWETEREDASETDGIEFVCVTKRDGRKRVRASDKKL